ncbi:retrovirus-related pol polyprotein from transposon TNT 1-94 [Tanacetum coccineum]
MEEVKGVKKQILIPLDTSSSVSQASSSKTPKQKVWYRPCKHYGMRTHLSDDCYSKLKCSTCGSISHTTKEHTEQTIVRKSLNNLKGQSTSKSTPDYLKRSVWYLDSGCSRHMTGVKQYLHIHSKEPDPKVFFGDDSSGDTEGYGLLCDAHFKVLFTKTQGTIFNQNDEVILIAPRRRDVYIIDMSSFNKEINACILGKASSRMSIQGTPGYFCLKKKSDAVDCVMSFIRKIENLNEVRVKELRSDNGTKLRNHKLEEFCDKKGISHNFSSLCTPKQNGVAKRRNRTLIEATRTISIIVKRYRKTIYDVFRGRAPDISYLHVFGCPSHIHNHRDHLGKFDEKADGGFFLGYSLMDKAFRVFNIRKQEIEKQFMTKNTQCFVNIDYFPYVSAYENTTSAVLPTPQNSITSEEPSEFTIANNLAAIHEPNHAKSADILESDEPQDNVLSESISDDQPALVISPSVEVIL